MKKFLSVLSALAFTLAFSVAVNAAEGQMIKGKVVSIDPAGKTIVIDTAEGQKTMTMQGKAKGVKPGMEVMVTCIDVEGKSCAKEIKIVHPVAEKHKAIEGEVVSIDPDGKTIVIKTSKGKTETVTVHEKAVVERVTVKKGAPAGEALSVETTAVKELKPGQKVKLDCIDSEGKFCANKITVVPLVPIKATEVTGKVVSLDPSGQTVVIQTKKGERTLYYQKATTGTPMEKLEVGKKVKAYCIDVEGKSCIKSIDVTK